MGMKRFLVSGILCLVFISMISGVLAKDYSDEAGGAAETFTSAVGGFFGEILSPLFGDSELLSRVFFALLLGMVIFSIVGTMFSSSGKVIQWGVTFAITCLALLGIPSVFLEAIRTQYGAMGAAILVMIPFMIILTFSLKSRSLVVARVTWFAYAVYYFALYIYQISILEKGWLSSESIPYLAAIILGILIFFGVGGIRKLLFKGEVEGIVEAGKKKIATRKALQGLQDEDLARYKG